MLSLRVQQLDVQCNTKTKDDVTLKVRVSVQYKVSEETGNVEKAYYRLSDPEQQIESYVYDVVRSTIPKMTLDEAYENKNQVAGDVKESLEHSMTSFGYSIIQALVVDITPDSKVQMAMNEINAAKRTRLAAEEKAEATKVLMVKYAEGEAESKHLSGLGVARQRQAIVNGLKESVLQFSTGVDGTSSADVINMMMTVQYMDMLKDVGSNPQGRTIFLNHSPGEKSELQQQVRDGFLHASKASQMTR